MADMAVRQVAVAFAPVADRPSVKREWGAAAAIGRFVRASIVSSCELMVGAMKQAPTGNWTVGAAASMAAFSISGPRVVG